jgi:subunit length determinant Wzz-like protein
VEIRDWLRALGDRVRLLVIVPLAAALIALLIGLVSPSQYRSTATVTLSGESGDGGPVTLVTTQRVADFSAAVTSQAVLSRTSAETGVPAGQLADAEVKRIAQSGIVEVAFTGTDESMVKPATTDLARNAFRLLAQADLDAATAKAQAAQDLVTNVENELTAAQNQSGLTYSDDLVDQASRRYTDALDAYNKALADGVQSEIDARKEILDQKAARLSDARSLQLLNSRRVAATTVLIQANSDVAAADGARISADTFTIPTTQATPLGKLKDVAQKVIFAGVFGFVLAAGLLVLLVLIQGRADEGSDDDEEPRATPSIFPGRRAADRS